MDTKIFNQNYEIDRKAKGVRANPKNAPISEPDILTADGAIYDAKETYYFFDESTKEIRQSLGLRRAGEWLLTFGLRVVEISKIRTKQDDALSDGQKYFRMEIEKLQSRIKEYENQKNKKAEKINQKDS